MWLVLADRREVLEDAVADVGPALDTSSVVGQSLKASCARAEDTVAAPPTLDVFDALEQASSAPKRLAKLTNLGFSTQPWRNRGRRAP